jgi:hypothetical protein
MSMSRRDFVALAEAIQYARGHAMASTNVEAELAGVMASAEYVANACKAANSNFKRERWFDYIMGKCGKNGGAR